MGASNPKIEDHKIKFMGEVQSDYLGAAKVYRTDRERLAVGVRNNKFKIDLMQHSSLSHPNLLNLLTYKSDSSEFLGVYQEDMYLYFDFVETSLSDIIRMRKSRSQYFTEDEVQRFMGDVLSALAYLEKTKSVAHYGISPKSIFYDKKTKKMVVYDNECIHGQLSCYYKFRNQEQTLVAPEMTDLLKSLKNNSHDPNFVIDNKLASEAIAQRNKIDVYMLGLTLLELCTYTDSFSLFSSESMSFNDNQIEQRIRQACVIYNGSAVINTLLRKMLEKEPSKRPSAYQLLQLVRKPSKKPQIQTNVNQQGPQMVRPQTTVNLQGMKQMDVRQAYFSRMPPVVRQRSLSRQVMTSRGPSSSQIRLPSSSSKQSFDLRSNPRMSVPQGGMVRGGSSLSVGRTPVYTQFRR